ncbi:hypothetical protein BTVI_37706 [Pitangus sulphuratus]|nr:hypothetical protein BTVI_37706 [Pitangus sulphuratus]
MCLAEFGVTGKVSSPAPCLSVYLHIIPQLARVKPDIGSLLPNIYFKALPLSLASSRAKTPPLSLAEKSESCLMLTCLVLWRPFRCQNLQNVGFGDTSHGTIDSVCPFLPMLLPSTVTAEETISHPPDSRAKRLKAQKSFLITLRPCVATSSTPMWKIRNGQQSEGHTRLRSVLEASVTQAPGGTRHPYGLGLVDISGLLLISQGNHLQL